VKCDDALVAVSLRADDELPDSSARETLDAHLATCADCRRFATGVQHLRSHLRVEPVDRVLDLGPAVVARLRATGATPAAGASGAGREPDDHRSGAALDAAPVAVARRAERDSERRTVAVAAAVAALAGMVVGATFVGIGTEPRSPAAADLPARVMAAQHDIRSVESSFTISEDDPAGSGLGTGPDAGETRTFEGHLVYRAPESLALTVRETTPGRPAADRAAADLVVDGDRWWQETARQCSPAAGLVHCPDEPLTWVRSVTGREPFSQAAPVPLELVSPVDSFALAAAPTEVGERTIAGHRAVGVAVTAAQVAPLLDGLSAGADLRPVHPADPVELWLDDGHLVPLALVVRAADDPARARWAATVGADARAGDVILAVTATSARVNGAVEADAFGVPAREPSSTADAGFRATPPGDGSGSPAPVPGDLPDGFRPHRSGSVATPGGPTVAIRSWSDGRAWLTVRATTQWPGGRLFGDLGLDVRPVDLGEAGIGYASGDGRRVGLHAAGRDVVVSGSLPADQLEAVAADLGLVGLAVPAAWAEAATATLDEAAEDLPGLLTSRATHGFGAATVRIDGDTVTQVRAGPGRRVFTLTQRRVPVLPPPSAGDETGVVLRGTTGRYSQQRGELEWIEGGTALSLRSDTLGLGELLTVAEHLEPA
jgi:Putative zinc-finger